MMKLISKEKTKTTCTYKLFNKITIYKKEKFISSKSYYFLGVLFLKKKIKPHKQITYILGIKVLEKRIDIISKIRPYANGKDFIYYCFHTGDFYYLCQIIKANMHKFKDTVIITNFSSLKQVLYLFDFEEKWINDHFIVVPDLWYFSYAIYCKSDGSVISQMELDHEKGWIVNGRLQKNKNKYLPINKIIQNFMGIYTITIPKVPQKQKLQNTILFLPESQFNGNLEFQKSAMLIQVLVQAGYRVAINSKSNIYDSLLNENVYKIFLSYKDTFDFANNYKAIIGVRSGLFDCLQELANGGVNCFVIYQNKHYQQYKFFKNFTEWFKSVYSFNLINNTTIFNEFNEINDFTVTQLLKELGD